MIWEFHFSFWLMKDADLDGESFIEMDLPGVNTLTAKVELKKRLSRNCQDLRGRNGEYFFLSYHYVVSEVQNYCRTAMVLRLWTGIRELIIM